MKLIKRLLKIIVALVLILVVGAVALVFLVDPNMFKPRIESIARDQGVELNINGNLGWQLWPALGVQVNDIRVAALESPEDPIATLSSASLRLAIRPLLSGNLEVHHLLIDGAELDLRVNEAGEGNWEALLPDEADAEQAATTPEPEPSEAEAPQELQLAVEQISLRNSALSYKDAGTGQTFELSSLNLELNAFNLQGNPFNLELSWRAAFEDRELFGNQPLELIGDLSSRLQLADDMSEARLTEGRLTLDLARAGASDDIDLTFSLQAFELLEAPRYQGNLSLEPFNLKALMEVLGLPAIETDSAQALTKLAFNGQFNGTAEQFSLDPLTIELDDTRIEGRFAVTDFSTQAIELVLEGDRLNIDDYLPPATEEEAQESEATGDEELIPLETVKSLNANVSLDFKQLQAMGLTFNDLVVRLAAKDGLVQLSEAGLNAYEGRFDARGQLDARGDTAQISFNSELANFQLSPVLADLEMDEKLKLSGALNGQAKGATRGLTKNQLMDALDAEAELSGAQVRLAPLNIEQRFCQMVNLVSQVEKAPQEWPNFTQMRQLAGQVRIDNQVVKVTSFDAEVSELNLGLQGQLNLKDELYNFVLPLKLGSEVTSDSGCRVPSNYWVNRSLSLLRCQGSLAELNPLSDCGFDSAGVQSLIKDFAEYRIKEKHGESIDAEKERARERVEEEKQKLRDKIREKLSGGQNEEKEGEQDETQEGETQDGEVQEAEPKTPEDRLKRLLGR